MGEEAVARTPHALGTSPQKAKTLFEHCVVKGPLCKWLFNLSNPKGTIPQLVSEFELLPSGWNPCK